MKLLLLFAVLIFLPVTAESEVCFHGCVNIDVDFLDVIRITSAGGVLTCPGGGCSSGALTAYGFTIVPDCATVNGTQTGIFCSTETLTVGQSYVVNSFGSGCSGTPQGCVKVCECD